MRKLNPNEKMALSEVADQKPYTKKLKRVVKPEMVVVCEKFLFKGKKLVHKISCGILTSGKQSIFHIAKEEENLLKKHFKQVINSVDSAVFVLYVDRNGATNKPTKSPLFVKSISLKS